MGKQYMNELQTGDNLDVLKYYFLINNAICNIVDYIFSFTSPVPFPKIV